jgi:hypothetical protein
LALARGDPAAALVEADRELAGAWNVDARKLEIRGQTLRAGALLALDQLDDAEAAIGAALDTAIAIAYPAGEWRALRLRAEAARRRRGDLVADSEHRIAERVTTLAVTLTDDALRRALYAASAVGHDARP